MVDGREHGSGLLEMNPGSKQLHWKTMHRKAPDLALTDEIWNFFLATN
jgi:hypothetical protein